MTWCISFFSEWVVLATPSYRKISTACVSSFLETCPTNEVWREPELAEPNDHHPLKPRLVCVCQHCAPAIGFLFSIVCLDRRHPMRRKVSTARVQHPSFENFLFRRHSVFYHTQQNAQDHYLINCRSQVCNSRPSSSLLYSRVVLMAAH